MSAVTEMQQWTTAADPEFAVTTCGEVPPQDVTRAVRAISRVLRRHHLDAPARVRVTAPEQTGSPTLVQANIRSVSPIDLSSPDTGTRVQVAGPGGFAVTFAAERLDRQLARRSGKETRGAWPEPARQSLSQVSAPRPIVRHKQCDLMTGTAREAATVLDAMDYDAYLFIDAETGEDAVVTWSAPCGIRLSRQHSVAPAAPGDNLPLTTHAMPVQVNAEPALQAEPEAAAALLCSDGLPHLFFTDRDTGRGSLLYRRYDGDLTLVTV